MAGVYFCGDIARGSKRMDRRHGARSALRPTSGEIDGYRNRLPRRNFKRFSHRRFAERRADKNVNHFSYLARSRVYLLRHYGALNCYTREVHARQYRRTRCSDRLRLGDRFIN